MGKIILPDNYKRALSYLTWFRTPTNAKPFYEFLSTFIALLRRKTKIKEKVKIKLIIVALILSQSILSQVPKNLGFVFSKVSSDDISTEKAKTFLLKEIINSPLELVKFEFDLLAATSTRELTSFYYKCEEKNKEGLILVLYGDYWTDAGDDFKGYVFKNLQKDQAIEFLSKITSTIEEQHEYIHKSALSNVNFQYDDISVLLYKNVETKIRISWNGFDAEWDNLAFNRTRNRFEKDLN